MCLEEECKKNATSPEAFGKLLFQSHLAKKLFPAISELVYVPRDGLCLITRRKFLWESVSGRDGFAITQISSTP